MLVTYAPPFLQGTYTQLNAIQVIKADLCAISKEGSKKARILAECSGSTWEVPEETRTRQAKPAALGKCQKKPELDDRTLLHARVLRGKASAYH